MAGVGDSRIRGGVVNAASRQHIMTDSGSRRYGPQPRYRPGLGRLCSNRALAPALAVQPSSCQSVTAWAMAVCPSVLVQSGWTPQCRLPREVVHLTPAPAVRLSPCHSVHCAWWLAVTVQGVCRLRSAACLVRPRT